MMRKRLLLILGCLAAVLLAGYLTLRLTGPRHLITEKNIRAIKIGMTEREVEAILGVPAGVYSSTKQTGEYIVGAKEKLVQKTGLDLVQEKGGKEWVGVSFSVYLRSDDAGRVTEIKHGIVEYPRLDFFSGPSRETNESFLDKLRSWLGI